MLIVSLVAASLINVAYAGSRCPTSFDGRPYRQVCHGPKSTYFGALISYKDCMAKCAGVGKPGCCESRAETWGGCNFFEGGSIRSSWAHTDTKTVMCVADNGPAPDNGKAAVRGKLIKTVALYRDYKLDVELTPKGFVRGWSNIVHVTANSRDHGHGARIPGLWFHGWSTRLHVCTSCSSWNTCLNPREGLPFGKRSKVTVKQESGTFKVYINDKLVAQTSCPSPWTPSNGQTGKLYASNPWYPASNVDIESLDYASARIQELVQGQFLYSTTDEKPMNHFNTQYALAGSNVIMRKCYNCPASHNTIYYKRITNTAAFKPYSCLIQTWATTCGGLPNVLNRDFELYSSLEDLVAGRNKWRYCNYNDPGVGFPRDCGPTGYVPYTWNAAATSRHRASGRTVAYWLMEYKTGAKWENGFCTRNRHDQNSGVIKVNSVDGNTAKAQNDCMKACLARPGATGCEVIWHQGNRGCYIHTQPITEANGVARHLCMRFGTAGRRLEESMLLDDVQVTPVEEAELSESAGQELVPSDRV